VLVGALSAIGIFLLTYKGYQPKPGERLSDKITARISGLSAIGVALFPVGQTTTLTTGFTFHNPLIHYLFAGIFFASLAVFSIFLFTKGDQTPSGKINWTRRNINFVACGLVIVLAIAALALYFVQQAKQPARDQYNYLFWWETLGVLAFATSWLIKGKTLTEFGKMWGRLTTKVSR
jgi:NADH:ubiquinone oxidoreductase subunit 6 (subunit J)